METLPVKVVHHIFDHLDAQTIVFSIRCLSGSFRSMVNSYERFILNFKGLSQKDFHLLCRLIKSENIISLTLSNEFYDSNEINSFFPYFRDQQFTRLRCLTLENIDQINLKFFVKRLNLTLLTSFSVIVRQYDETRCFPTSGDLCTSMFTQSALRNFEISTCDYDVFYINCQSVLMIQYLSIDCPIGIHDLHKILQCSSHLHTVILKERFNLPNHMYMFGSPDLTAFRQLQSLTIEIDCMNINDLIWFLSLTSSLNYLKIIGRRIHRLPDGPYWEEFIQSNLTQLNKFDFFFDNQLNSQRKTLEELESINSSFQTPFWIEDKQWFVICECNNTSSFSFYCLLYTLPICINEFEYKRNMKRLPSSAVTMMAENNIVESVIVSEKTYDNIEEQETTINYPRFIKATHLKIHLAEIYNCLVWASIRMVIDITKIMQITLDMKYLNTLSEDLLKNIDLILEQAHNLSTLIICGGFVQNVTCSNNDNIYSILPRQLKHLEITIENLDQMKRVLERCKNLSKVNFCIGTIRIDKITKWFADNTINSVYWVDRYGKSITIWLGKKNSQSNNDTAVKAKRMKINS